MMWCTKQNKQAGAALITAMLLAALITVLAASWLARFDSHLRVTEVQRMGTQARWLLRAATDWARMIIGEDTPAYDDLTEVWAVPIAPIRMTDIAGAQEAYFSGRLIDAQGLFNVHNVRLSGADPGARATQLAWAQNLMRQLGLSPAQASAWLNAIQALPASKAEGAQLLDTLPVGISSAVKAAIEMHMVWLPEGTKLNINTASATVLAAHPLIGDSMAQQMVTTRTRAPVRDANNLANAFGISSSLAAQFDVKTQYFIAVGRLSVGRIDVMARSLLQRQANGAPPRQLWSQAL